VRVLIIDDHEDTRALLNSTLLGTCSTVITEQACGSSQAIEMLINDTVGFNLIISDFEMPDGSGLAVLNYLESVGNQVPVILFTGWPFGSNEFRRFEFVTFIEKTDYDGLKRAISALLPSQAYFPQPMGSTTLKVAP